MFLHMIILLDSFASIVANALLWFAQHYNREIRYSVKTAESRIRNSERAEAKENNDPSAARATRNRK